MIQNYRNIVTLKGGVRVLLRPMIKDDEQELINLFTPTGNEDLRYLRDNVQSEADEF